MNNSASVSETSIAIENPYVGPAAFTRERHRLFKGREHETYDLGALLAARRLVLFYAQSGAGKTSLINAGLIPLLEKKRGFEVLPVARPSGTAPHGIPPTNIFVYNLMVHIDKSGRATQCCADLNLTDFLLDLGQQDGHYVYLGDDEEILSAEFDEVPGAQPGGIRRRALIIDQFEELFTAHPGEYEARAEFFAQLTEAMEDDPYLYVLISMRADYVHHLTRYVHLLPDGLRSRYYMPRLRYDAALRAVREPAQEKHRDFAPGVAEELVAHLRRERSQDPTGGDEQWTYGETVEPVQLQVVCYQLWESLTNSVDTITRADLIHLAHNVLAQEEDDADPLATFVDSALGTYYEQSLTEALRTTDTDTTEEYLRYWFSHKLITEAGTRGFLLRGDTETAGLPEEVVKALEKRRLLRSETRAGGRWVELIHDSFIDPLREANEAWTQQRMRQTPWVADAYRWEKATKEKGEDQAEHLLLRDDLLTVALQEAGDLNRQPAVVRDFLLKSERAEANRKRIEADRRQAEARRRAEEAEARNKQLSRQRLGLTFFGVVAAIATVIALVLNANLDKKQDELVQALSTLESVNKDLTKEKEKVEIAYTELSTQTQKLAESQSSLKETTLEREAQEYLERGEPIGAMLLSLAATHYGSENPPQGTLLRALESTYINQEIEGSFRLRARPPFTATRIFPGTAPRTVILASSSSELQAWDPMSGTAATWSPGKGDLIAVSPDGSTVATIHQDDTGKSVTVAAYQDVTPTMIITISEQSRIAAGGFDQTASTFAIALCYKDTEDEDDEQRQCELQVRPLDEREMPRPLVLDENVTDIAHFDSSTLIWANQKGDLYRWRWEETLEPEPLSTPQEHKTQALLSGPDERSFYTAGCVKDEYGCDQGFFQRWILDDKGELLPEGALNATTSIIALARVQDTSQIAALYNGGESVVIWESDTAEWPALACDAAGRNLTYDEWHETMEPFEIDRSNSRVCEDYGVNGLDISFAIQAVKACNMEEARSLAAEASSEDEETFLTATALQVTLKHLMDEIDPIDPTADCMLQQAVDLMNDRPLASKLADTQPLTTEGVARVLSTMGDWRSRLVTQVHEIDIVFNVLEQWPLTAREALLSRIINQYDALCHPVDGFSLPDERACAQFRSALESYRTLDYGDVVSISGENPSPWQFVGGVGDVISINVDSDSAYANASISLYDADNSLVAQGAESLESILYTRGLYIVRLDVESMENSRFSLKAFEPDILADGQTATARTDSQSLWQFDGEAGEFVSIAMDSIDGDVDAYLELLDTYGTTLDYNDDGGDGWNALLTHPLPASRRYFVRATSIGAAGRYELTLTRLKPTTLSYGRAVTITEPHSLWQFSGEAEDIVQVAARAERDSPDITISLLDHEGQTIDQATRTLETLLTTSGQYFVYLEAGSAEAYTLSIDDVELETLDDGRTVTARTDERSLWQFEGQAGDFVSIAMDGIDGDVDAYLELLDANGTSLSENDDGGDGWNSRLVYPLPASGRYFVRTTSIGAAGRYELTLTRVDAATLRLGDTVTGTTAERPTWAFEGSTGEIVTVDLKGASELFDPYLTLVDPSGATLAEDDDSGQGFMSYDARIRPLVLPAEGRYTIVAGRSGSFEPYTLSLKTLDQIVQAYTSKLERDPTYQLESADEANRICWFGSLEGYAEDVLPACANAVTLYPNDTAYRDSRGLARALTGDVAGAIADFEFALAQGGGSDSYVASRTAWVTALREGQDPADIFDEATLEELKDE